MSNDKQLSISFYSKQKYTCPFCTKDFNKEEILSGGGRMIAGSLEGDLRRNFEPSAKYGYVYPLIYSIAACPHCHAALLWKDLDIPFDKEIIEAINFDEFERKKTVERILPFYDLERNRTLYDGVAAYYLALLCYEKIPSKYSPTIKKAIISLRLAWLSGDLNRECPNRGFDYIQNTFYLKALFLYQNSLTREQQQVEEIASVGHFGPDIDKNYGFDGVIYLCGYLEFIHGQRTDMNARLKKLDEFKRAIARSFGLGKSSKAKPGPLLELSRALYDNIRDELQNANVLNDDDDEEE